MPSPLKRPFVLLLSGSTRTPSHTRMLTHAVAEAIELSGGETYHWDARDPLLPIADPAFHKNACDHHDEQVRRLDALAKRADGFVLGSPVYHNSYSGVLKNMLDHLNIPHFRNKPVGLVSHGGDRSTQAVDHLRVVVRGLNAVATPTHVCTRSADYRVDGGNILITDKDIVGRIGRLATELVAFAVLLRPLQEPTFTPRLIEELTSQTDGTAEPFEKHTEVVEPTRRQPRS